MIPPTGDPLAGEHPTPQTLAAFLAGRLSCAECDTIEGHVAVCQSCCQALREVPPDSLAQYLRSGSSWVAAALADDGNAAQLLANHPRYHVLELLGTGGMGAVYKARHLLMDRVVALKVIHRRLLRKPEAIERFRREVKAAASLTHPNIVTAHDAEQAGDCHFLVMEFIEGQSLVDLVKEQGPLEVAVACGFVCQAALGLQHAFEHGMVHRDIKPQNLMLTPQGHVKILDFGLAHVIGHREVNEHPDHIAQGSHSAATLTQASSLLGTPDYMAPEQTTDPRAVDVRSDIYALGCTLYYLLTGEPPFPEGTAAAKLAAHRQVIPQPLTNRRADIPLELVPVIERMLAKDPAERYQTPAEVASALRPFSQSLRASPRRGWRSLLLAGMAAAVLMLAAVVIYMNTGEGTVVLTIHEPDVKVTIDGQQIQLKSPRDEISVRVGRHKLEVSKEGFTTYTEAFEVRRGGKVELTAQLTRANANRPLLLSMPAELMPAAQRIEAGLPWNPADKVVATLRQELISYRARHPGSPEAIQAARLMTRLAWPADALKPASIPVEELAAAGEGEAAKAPAAIVVIFGDSRLKHWSAVNCVAMSKDGKLLASGGYDGVVRTWEADTGKPRHVLRCHTDEVLSVAISPDGETLASAGTDGMVRLWNTATGQERYTCRGHGSWVNSVAFSADGLVVYSGSRDGTARVWGVADGKERTTFRLSDKSDEVLCLALSPDGKIMASGGRDHKVKLWNAASGTELQTLAGHRNAVWALAFSPDSQTLASAGWDHVAKLWDVASGQERHTLTGHSRSLWSAGFDPSGRTLVTGDEAGSI